MLTISKGPPPKALVQYLAEARAGRVRMSYADFPGKDELRASLLSEQRGLCCYCMRRMERGGRIKVKIEHWRCQARYPNLCLEYTKLLLACDGNENTPSDMRHCDTSKANCDLSRNPADPTDRVGEIVSYESSGRIRSFDTQLDRELDKVLNLNYPNLVKNRKAALEGMLRTLGRGQLRKRRVKKLIADWDGSSNGGDLKEYCGIVVYYLRKKLERVPA